MSEPNWRELGDPWADRLPPEPRSEVSFRHAHRLAQTRRMSPADPVIAWIGDVAVIHGERDDSEMCLCGAPDYLTCPDWIAGNGTVSSLTFQATPQQDDMRCTCGHREEDHAGGNCLQGGLLDACDCYGFQPWIDR